MAFEPNLGLSFVQDIIFIYSNHGLETFIFFLLFKNAWNLVEISSMAFILLIYVKEVVMNNRSLTVDSNYKFL